MNKRQLQKIDSLFKAASKEAEQAANSILKKHISGIIAEIQKAMGARDTVTNGMGVCVHEKKGEIDHDSKLSEIMDSYLNNKMDCVDICWDWPYEIKKNSITEGNE